MGDTPSEQPGRKGHQPDRLAALGRIPTAEQAPEIICEIVEVPHPNGPQGAKSFAEAPSLATAPAIVNAIYDALGVRITSLPADKKKVLQALQSPKELSS
jgi:CO/xanthine dehydrogenase Mo-binding subunit